jgi:transposase
MDGYRARRWLCADCGRTGTGVDPSGDEARHWTLAARLEAVIATAAMNQAGRSAWCREHGVYPTEVETWKRDAIGGLGEPRETESAVVKQERRRHKELIARTRRWPKRPPCSC